MSTAPVRKKIKLNFGKKSLWGKYDRFHLRVKFFEVLIQLYYSKVKQFRWYNKRKKQFWYCGLELGDICDRHLRFQQWSGTYFFGKPASIFSYGYCKRKIFGETYKHSKNKINTDKEDCLVKHYFMQCVAFLQLIVFLRQLINELWIKYINLAFLSAIYHHFPPPLMCNSARLSYIT